jgi:glycine betaine/proline transport system ATP-binding protein
MNEMIQVSNLFKIFGDRPHEALELLKRGVAKEEILARTGQAVGVQDASFTVNEGEIFVVMGLSGSGKSTLVRLLNRLIEPSAGKVVLGGRDIAALSEAELLQVRRKDMAMVFQSFALMPHLNVIDNVAFGLELAGVPRETRKMRAISALEQVGLAEWASNFPDELSGGMQQRVGLARALANDPSVLLMDEAFSALDPLIRTEMQDELLKLQSEHRRTVIFISHDIDEAMRLGDRIAIMKGGRIVQIGTSEEILNNPADDYVRSFFRGIDVGAVLSAGDIARKRQVTHIERRGAGPRTALKRLEDEDRDYGYVLGSDMQFHGVVSVDSLSKLLNGGGGEPQLAEAFIEVEPVRSDEPLNALLGRVANAPCGVPVVTEGGKYLGVISRATLLETLDRKRGADARE